jgi:hypothetical protein
MYFTLDLERQALTLTDIPKRHLKAAGLRTTSASQNALRGGTHMFCRKLCSISALALSICSTSAVAAELPTYEVMGFPITQHQLVAVDSGHVRERSPIPTLTLGGMPASPHQILVLTPRPRITEQATAKSLTKAGFSAPE